MTQPVLPYNGKSGHVSDSDTSTDRAIHEDATGITAKRQLLVLDYVAKRGSTGATWRDVADDLGLHHGQASGVLSVLHGAGRIFVWKASKRLNCQVYVDASFRDFIRPEDREDSPRQTSNTKQRLAHDALMEAIEAMLYCQTMTTIQEVRTRYNEYKERGLWAST
jgi:hypothetical protein